jgi:hypothetical protein
MPKPNKKHRSYLPHNIIIGAIGLIMSIVLHEAFHIWMHWGEIVSIRLFTGFSIAEVVVIEREGHDVLGEEMAAYLITILVIMATIMIIYKLSDAHDTHTVKQLLFPGKEFAGMKRTEFLRLAASADIAPEPQPVVPKRVVKKPKKSTKQRTKAKQPHSRH